MDLKSARNFRVARMCIRGLSLRGDLKRRITAQALYLTKRASGYGQLRARIYVHLKAARVRFVALMWRAFA